MNRQTGARSKNGLVLAEDAAKWQKRLVQFLSNKKTENGKQKQLQRKIHFGKKMAPNVEQVTGLDLALQGGVGGKLKDFRPHPLDRIVKLVYEDGRIR